MLLKEPVDVLNNKFSPTWANVIFQDTALHVAVKAGNKVMVKELLQRWATINKRSEKHRSGSKSNKSNTNSVSTAPLIEPKMFDKIFGANEDGENPLTLAVKSNERWMIHDKTLFVVRINKSMA